MPRKLIVLVHGIGDSRSGFHYEWKRIIAENHDLENVTVKELLWEEVLQKVADQYGLLSGESFAGMMSMCGFQNLERLAGNAEWQLFQDYLMDVLVYTGLPEMWLYIQNTCARKLAELRQDGQGREVFRRSDTLLIGHSLGAAMLPQLVWRERTETFATAMPYHGMILLASPLGFRSPYPNICRDFLQHMGHPGTDRISVLKSFALAWDLVGDGRLRLINNRNDIVCSDVKYRVPATGEWIDLIPLRQGFTPEEEIILNQYHPGCLQWVEFGSPDPGKIVENHDVLTYLKQDAFNEALRTMLA